MPALLAGTMIASTAQADSTYIKPSSTNSSGENNMVTFDAAGADHLFYLDHRPVQLNTITVTRPDGTPGTVINGLQQRFRSVFDLRLDQQGTWRIAAQQTMVTGTFMADGQERRVGGRRAPTPAAGGERQARAGEGQRAPANPGAPVRLPPVALADMPANATDVHLTEVINRTETFVTQGAPTDVAHSGKGLEFDPVTHPNAVVQGETARFRYLLDGKPAAGITVTVVADGDRYREATDALTLTTDKDGQVAITWPKAGLYWVSAQTQDKNPGEKRAELRRMITSETLEVMTP
ncbi:MAG: DUF4198 domain-containing protein [Sphingomonadales bacterium]|nr:DUF4198 domain-containing protein [Sphingomonadales bacterium]MDE2168220.1 DUF4198 domain-containing protein [Sphingomonadales bacterium]